MRSTLKIIRILFSTWVQCLGSLERTIHSALISLWRVPPVYPDLVKRSALAVCIMGSTKESHLLTSIEKGNFSIV